LQWYRDAIIYQLHVKSYFDATMTASAISLASRKSSITSRSRRDRGLGHAILSSPLRDDAMTFPIIAESIPPMEPADFKRFLREAHERGLRVITSS